MSVIKIIKKEAVVKIELGTAFIEKLQNILTRTAESVTEEEIQNFKKLLSNNEPLTEHWMNTIATVSALLKLIETKAEEQGFIEDVNLDDYLNSITNSNLFSKDGDSPLHQFPKQPE